VTGTVTLRGLTGPVRGVSAVALDGAGKAVGAPIVARRSASGWVLPIGATTTTWYLVRVERR
jgi:ABC-type cobalamin transport system permease subunit